MNIALSRPGLAVGQLKSTQLTRFKLFLLNKQIIILYRNKYRDEELLKFRHCIEKVSIAGIFTGSI